MSTRLLNGPLHTEGVVKLNYGQAGDTSGGLGLNPWQFSLTAGVETQINPPLPSAVSDSSHWSRFVRAQDDSELFVVDGTYGTRIIEQKLVYQWHTWRFIIDYTRSDAAVDEQLKIRLLNPISGFSIPSAFQMIRGNVTGEGMLSLITIADAASIPEAGSGAGYQILIESTIGVDISIRSMSRFSAHTTEALMY